MNELTDERKFQELIKDITVNQEIKRNIKKNYDKNTKIKKVNQIKDIYFSNDLSIVHFGNNLFN